MSTTAAKSDYLENKIIDHVLRNTSYTPAATVYAALFTSNPAEDYSGTEVTGGSYARQSVSFTAASGGATSNSADVTFTGLPAATITHIGVMDALTTGNLLYYAQLDSSVTVTSGSTVIITAGDLDISET